MGLGFRVGGLGGLKLRASRGLGHRNTSSMQASCRTMAKFHDYLYQNEG